MTAGFGLKRVLLSGGSSCASVELAPPLPVELAPTLPVELASPVLLVPASPALADGGGCGTDARCASFSSGTRSAMAVVGVCLLDLQSVTSCCRRCGSTRSPLSGGGTACSPTGTCEPRSSMLIFPALTSAGVAVSSTRTEQPLCALRAQEHAEPRAPQQTRAQLHGSTDFFGRPWLAPEHASSSVKTSGCFSSGFDS